MTFDAAEEFASRVGDNTRLIDSELRKLLDLVPEDKISLKMSNGISPVQPRSSRGG